MNSIDKMYVYDDNKLSLVVIRNFRNNPLVIYEKEISRFRVEELNSNSFVDKLKVDVAKVNAAVIEVFGEKIQENDNNLLFNPQKLEMLEVEYRHKFEESVIMTEKNIKKIVKNGIEKETIDSESLVFDYSIIEYDLDSKIYKQCSNIEAKDIKIRLKLVIIDSKTINQLIDLFYVLNIKFERHYLIDSYLLKALKKKNIGFIDLNYEFNKVLYVQEDENREIKYLNTGIKIILEKIYEVLAEKYDDKKAEELTRFVKKNWILKTFDYQYDIIKGVDIEEIIELTQMVVFEYFKLLIPNFRENLNIDEIYINSGELYNKELAKFLSQKFSIEIKPLFASNNIISSTLDKKVQYCLSVIYKEV